MDLIIKALENAISTNSKVIESYFSQELRESNEEISKLNPYGLFLSLLDKLYNTYLHRNAPYSTLYPEMIKIIMQKNLEKTNVDSQYASLIKGSIYLVKINIKIYFN